MSGWESDERFFKRDMGSALRLRQMQGSDRWGRVSVGRARRTFYLFWREDMIKTAVAVVGGLAVAASAQISGGTGVATPANENVINLADYANITTTRLDGNAIVTIEFTSTIASWDYELDPDNVVLVFNMGGPATIHGIGWDVSIEALGFSWLSEAYVNFGELG